MSVSGLIGRMLQFREGGLLAVIFLLSAALTALGGSVTVKVRVGVDSAGDAVFESRTQNSFANFDTLLTLMKESSFIAVMAIGATMVIILAGIDLSVGAVYSLSAVAGALVFHHWGSYALYQGGVHQGLPFWEVALAGGATCIGVGLLCGFLNGTMITALRMHPFIITLGTMAIYRGIAFVITHGQAITPFPPELQGIVRWDVGPTLHLGSGLFPIPLGVMILVAVAGTILLNHTVLGREIYAVGDNRVAAICTGLRVNRITIFVFTLAGGLAALSSLVFLGYYGSASSDAGLGYELDVIAAAVVGGASLTGGRGSALGTVFGAILIKMIDQGIVILKIDQNYSRIIIGSVIILAVGLDQLNQWYTQKRLAQDAAGV